MAEKKGIPGRIRLEDVRLSFADLFTPRTFQGEDEGAARYKASFLIPKTGNTTATYHGTRGPIMKMLKRAKLDAITSKIGEQEAAKVAKRIEPGNYAVRDGDYKEYDGYEGHYFLSSTNRRPPQVIGRDKRPLKAEDGVVYSGCYVNAIVTLWYQAAGRRGGNAVPTAVWATLEAVQFVRDGEAFGAAPVDTDEEFDDVTDDDDFVDEGADDDDDIPF